MTTMNDYQDMACSFAIYPEDMRIVYPTLGLVGEAGEVAEKVKKMIRKDGELDLKATAKELGDVLWYIANLANDLGYSLEDVAQMNIMKLTSRQERGVIKGNGDDR